MRQKLEDLALRAGEQIMLHYQGPDSELAVRSKADGSPVSIADLSAHKILMTGLTELSGLPVISEEDLTTR